jgi:acyl carrier protein
MIAAGSIQMVLYDALATSRQVSVNSVIEQVGNGGEIDSLEGLEILIAAESHFGVAIDESQVTPELCRSIPRLAAAVEALTKQEGR